MQTRANRAIKVVRCLDFLGWTRAMKVARVGERIGGCDWVWTGRDKSSTWRGVRLEMRGMGILMKCRVDGCYLKTKSGE